MSAVEAAAGKAQAMVRDSVKTVIAASMSAPPSSSTTFTHTVPPLRTISRRCSSETPPIRPSRC